MTMRVLSLDFDGCLFHMDYISAIQKNVIKSNEKFLQSLKEKNKFFSKTKIIVGSNRQSYEIDAYNSGNKGSCYPAIKEIAQYLWVELDTFLLADLYGSLESGTSFNRAVDPNYKGEHSSWVFDSTKATLLYAQIHKIAMENPHEAIEFDFYDDRKDDILRWLSEFHTANPSLIPENVSLNLHFYAGGEVEQVAKIQGTGFIDANYKETVKQMTSVTMAKNGGSHVALYIKESDVTTRIPFKKPPLQEKSNPVPPVIEEDEFAFLSTVSSSQHGFFNPAVTNKTFPNSYTKIWQQASHLDKNKIKALLVDYTKEEHALGSLFGRILTLHWRRHHVKAVHEIIHDMSKSNKFESAEDVLTELQLISRVKGGSLDRRIQFISAQLEAKANGFNSANLGF